MHAVAFFALFLTALAYGSDPALNGLWEQPCAGKFRRIETLWNDFATLSEINYSDAACTRPLIRNESNGQITTSNPPWIDFRFESVVVTLLEDTLTAHYNQVAMCGVTDWETGTPKNITGGRCDFFGLGKAFTIPHLGEMRYGIYEVRQDPADSRDQLFFGKLTPTQNGTTPELRPTSWDPRFFTRQ